MPIEIAPEGAEPKPPGLVPLDALHRSLGARMVEFAGYMMPLQYPAGIMTEHRHTREHATLFDVSHMGQATLEGADAAAALETLVPADVTGLKPMRQRYMLLTNEAGGIVDDLMVANLGDAGPITGLMIVANASRKDIDFARITEGLPTGVRLVRHDDRALLALQGPQAAEVLARHAPEVANLTFMSVTHARVGGVDAIVARSGYTGEDGFEISVHAADAEALARTLLAEPEVMPAGLGARDSLRLEAGLCLFGNDIDELTSPVEAGLTFAIAKRRREQGGYPGAAVVADHLANGPVRHRVGLLPEGRAPVRAGCEIIAPDGTDAGSVTSGVFSPTLGVPIAMGYVRKDLKAIGTPVQLMLRGALVPARVAALPFVPHRYVR